jgi:hypothetical protein
MKLKKKIQFHKLFQIKQIAIKRMETNLIDKKKLKDNEIKKKINFIISF